MLFCAGFRDNNRNGGRDEEEERQSLIDCSLLPVHEALDQE